MRRIFARQRGFASAIATAMYVLFCILLGAIIVVSLPIYLFGGLPVRSADRLMFAAFSVFGGVMFFDSLRTRLLRRPCRTKYGIIGPLEPGWSAFVSAGLLGGIVVFGFGLLLGLLSDI
jgi:hypothetical protein